MQEFEQPFVHSPEQSNIHESSNPQVQPATEVLPQASKISKSLIFTLSSFAVLLAGAFCFLWWYSGRSSNSIQVTSPEQVTNPETTLVPEPTPYVDKKTSWKVIDTENNTAILDKSEYDTAVVYKVPFLYFRNNEDSQQLIQLNLETGNKKVLYTDVTSRTVNSIQLVNNTVFFTTGGYMVGGALFYLDENDSVHQLDDHEYGGGSIQEESGNYWLIGSQGDSCSGQSRYSLVTFNPQPVVTPKVESHSGCNDGEEVLAITPTHFLMTQHTVDESIEGWGSPASVYNSIFTRPIQNPQEKTELIPASTMPRQVQNIEYNEVQKKLWLLGNTPAAYNIASNQVLYFDQQLPFIPATWANGSWIALESGTEKISRSETGYCIEQLDENQVFIKGYILNFQTQTVEELSTGCPEIFSPVTDYDDESKQKIQLKFKELGLPEKYSLEIYQTEVVY